jgi:hypothetical protein
MSNDFKAIGVIEKHMQAMMDGYLLSDHQLRELDACVKNLIHVFEKFQRDKQNQIVNQSLKDVFGGK